MAGAPAYLGVAASMTCENHFAYATPGHAGGWGYTPAQAEKSARANCAAFHPDCQIAYCTTY